MDSLRGAALSRIIPAVLALALAVGCGVTDNEERVDGSPATPELSRTAVSPTITTPSSTTVAPPATLPPSAPWVPSAGEPAPEAKELASQVVEAIGTYGVGEGTLEGTRQRIAVLSAVPEVANTAGPMLAPGAASVLQVVYPQLGGLTADSASVMVVARHTTLPAGADQAVSVTRTIDVRLESTPQGWRVTQLASVGGTPPPQPMPSALGQQVVDHPGIDLPDSAVWDIQAGRVSDVILQRLLELAAERTVSVTVLATGHPHEVFGRASVSNHTVGRGVDIWALDGIPVAMQRGDDSPLIEVVKGLIAGGVTEVGSPWDLDGPGTASFTNTVHHDHIHLAYDG